MKYFLDLFGCVKNQVDAENMMSGLNKAGWENVSEAESADLIIVNSCGFIESAKQESINAVLGWHKTYPGKKILLAGCLAQRYAKELAEILPEACAFMGTEYQGSFMAEQAVQIAEKIVSANSIINPQIKTANLKLSTPKSQTSALYSAGERPLLSLPGSAYVKISEGCSNNCSYCAIPLIRGKQVSRSIPDILQEYRALINRGIKEICIIGQDIGAFAPDSTAKKSNKTSVIASKLPQLLDAISALKGKFWVRLLYIHPDHFPVQILDIMERDERFLPYFDIPFQHASPKILAAMNRRGTAEKYLALLAIIRGRLERAVIRSTFLLGFPGETNEDFEMLCAFQEKAALDWLGCFTYSGEEGTAAYSMKGKVPKKTAAARKKIIEERQIPITERKMERFTGLTMDVLTEEKISAAGAEDIFLGRLYCQAPDIDGSAVIINGNKDGKILHTGTLVPCKITARNGFDLEVQIL
ncbi:MAG: 30S ribosomal protein S12 methylthiotransferase RimO [Treponema sp.]|nr:30S ribosomal protein S12 methylthiotransferase RimO [Treponema sp.]